jgi:hypothetical protein
MCQEYGTAGQGHKKKHGRTETEDRQWEGRRGYNQPYT